MTLNIETVWQKTTPALRQEITDFWEANRMLPAGTDARERATQAVQIVRSPEGAIAGLTTADFVQFKQLNNNLFYLFRMAVLPEFRVPGIESKLIVDTRGILEAIANRTWAVWPASKMVYIGSDNKGRHIRVYYFKGARI
jgi:hypothetical protein